MKPTEELDGHPFHGEAVELIMQGAELLQEAIGPLSMAEFKREFHRLCDAGMHDEARKFAALDREKIRRALILMREGLKRDKWYVAGVEVPEAAEKAVMAAPRRYWQSMFEGIEATIRGLAGRHPKLHRILDNATARREEGQVFAEASREVRDRNYRERVEWVASKYREVRGKYAAGDAGDKAARLEVAVLYSRFSGKKRMHDRTVCNILDAARAMELAPAAGTAG